MDLDGILHAEEVLAMVRERHQQLRCRPLLVFCAATGGRVLIQLLRHHGLEPDAVCDNSPATHGQRVEGLVVQSPIAALESLGPEANIVVGSVSYYGAIRRQLLAAGVSPERVLNGGLVPVRLAAPGTELSSSYYDPAALRSAEGEILRLHSMLGDPRSRMVMEELIRHRYYGPLYNPLSRISERDQYFVPALVPLNDQEVFLDVGAFDGDTVAEFVKRVPGGRYAGIHAFEPAARAFARLQERTSNLDRVDLHMKGLSDHEGLTRFQDEGTVSSRIRADGDSSIELVRGDLLGLAPTLIKMDVEGEEMRALAGLEKTIRTHRPKLAICVYHRFDDLWTIPLHLMSLVPEYRIALRHHTSVAVETVCYAAL